MEAEQQEQFYLSPIANPLANDTMRAKLLKLVRHLNKDKKLKRGVKDVVKSIKKGARGLCVIAADVSPVDVVSHIPGQC
jgi:H/ACA ribonucleoprotein complex subunit 2